MMRIHFVLCCACFLLCGCKDEPQVEIEPARFEFRKDTTGELRNAEGKILATLDLEIADDAYERETGLMHRSSMAENHGMLFIFPEEGYRSFYMKNTLISLDIIYLDSDYRVVSIQKNTKIKSEQSLPSEAPAQYVLEVNAGLSDRWGLKQGDILQVK